MTPTSQITAKRDESVIDKQGDVDSDPVYQELIRFIRASGKRLVGEAGKLPDIGVTKEWVTQEDYTIERGLKEIILRHHPDHAFYAEEENDFIPSAKTVWVADPISGTKAFLDGLEGYAIVIAQVIAGSVFFGAVYDPSADALYTAFKGKGAFLNGKPIHVRSTQDAVTESGESSKQYKPSLIFNLSSHWNDKLFSERVMASLGKYDVIRTKKSQALNVCHFALGLYDGTVSLTKDSFPMFAAAIIVQEAGGSFTNHLGTAVTFTDRRFIGGITQSHSELKNIFANLQ